MQALVYKSTGSWYLVKDKNGVMYNSRIKGVLKIDGITSTNPVAVGDVVDLEMGLELDGTPTVMITGVSKRKNYITRVSPHNKHQHHIIAANLDQCFLFSTLKEPKTSTGFIDRFLITAEAYHIPAVIVFNKTDLFREKEKERLAELSALYTAAGYTVVSISIKNHEGLHTLSELLKNKTTLLSGHSGVGKSSFINQFVPDLKLKTQDVSSWSGKGLHTTTFAEMYDLPEGGGRIVDTPGIRELGLVDISKQELSHYFPEMRSLIGECQFNNCLHINEPGCAIKDAVREGRISEERYVNYVIIAEDL